MKRQRQSRSRKHQSNRQKMLMLTSLWFLEETQQSNLQFVYQMLHNRMSHPLQLTYSSVIHVNIRNLHQRMYNYFEEWVPRYLEHDFFMHFRMMTVTYNKLVNMMRPYFVDNPYRGGHERITLEKAVLITLWYLSKGDTLSSVSDRFNVSLSSTYYVTTKVIGLLCILRFKVIIWPKENECEEIAQEFLERASFPGVVGAMDGCHIICKIPLQQHDSYQDRKFHHSITLQGICTAKKVFTNISTGYPGAIHDSRVLSLSSIKKNIDDKGRQYLFYNHDYHLVADSAYSCKNWLLTPFRDNGHLSQKQRNYNYVLSITRVVIEHAFGMLKERWRILKYINVNSVQKAANIIVACCVLHNICLQNDDSFNYDDRVEVSNNINQEQYMQDNDTNGCHKRNGIMDIL